MHLPLSCEGGELTVKGRTQSGIWTQSITIPATKRGAGTTAIASAWARERVSQLETRRMAGHGGEDTENEIRSLGLAFSISTRLTSWVAISQNNPIRRLARSVNQPHAVPAGVNIEMFGLRKASGQRRLELMPSFHALYSEVSHNIVASQDRSERWGISDSIQAEAAHDWNATEDRNQQIEAKARKRIQQIEAKPPTVAPEEEATETSRIKSTLTALLWLCLSPILLLLGIGYGVYLLGEMTIKRVISLKDYWNR
jgi:hypothetical protein